MSITFSGGELVDIAIGIEKQGIVFYDVMASYQAGNSSRFVYTSG